MVLKPWMSAACCTRATAAPQTTHTHTFLLLQLSLEFEVEQASKVATRFNSIITALTGSSQSQHYPRQATAPSSVAGGESVSTTQRSWQVCGAVASALPLFTGSS
jgi:hypothetical protein